MTLPFVHLRVHSDLSFGKGASQTKAIVSRVQELGQPAVCVADRDNLHGAFKFSEDATGKGVQPLVGVALKVVTGKGGKPGTMILVAQDQPGFANLCRLLDLVLAPGRPGRGNFDVHVMKHLANATKPPTDGVIALAGTGSDSVVGEMARSLDHAKATEMLRFLAWMFPGRFYVEVCRSGHPTDDEVATERFVVAEARRLSLPLVATSDVRYAREADRTAWEVIRASDAKGKACLRYGADGFIPSEPRRYHLRTSEEMASVFADLPDAYENAVNLARRCSFVVPKHKPMLPDFPVEGGGTEADEMRSQSRAGLDARLVEAGIVGDDVARYHERLEFELGVIERMNFPGYFLIVSDFIKWAKAQGIPVGPGRGSGAGSLVAWALQITDLDPIPFGLMFERFLNPDRVSMPDFDVDFCPLRVHEVLAYVRDKYGPDRVAKIQTFTSLLSKAAMKAAGRVVTHVTDGPMSQMDLNRANLLIPKSKTEAGKMETLSRTYETVRDFKQLVDDNPRIRAVYEAALTVEGARATTSTHAAGVVITKEPLTSLVPVGYEDKTDFSVVQYDMKAAESSGLVKFDFLALKNLTVIKDAVDAVAANHGVDVTKASLTLDCKDTFDMLSEGHGAGVFQLESAGMQNAMKDLGPSTFDDIIALISLYRPGPMDLIPQYVACKRGADPVYPEPREKTEPVLRETFGIMVYQEQVMKVAQEVAGFTLAQADLLRRAMGKKIKSEMDAQQAVFIEGAERNGVAAKTAKDLFELIQKFASYGFNKSHAAGYALVCYQTAWLKRNHPAEFVAAAMTYEAGREALNQLKKYLDKVGVELLPPCVNASQARFVTERAKSGRMAVRFGLSAINGFSEDAAILQRIVEARGEGGPFTGLEDFHTRVGTMNSQQMQKLCEVGAFTALEPVRARAHAVLGFLAKDKKQGPDLFGGEAKAHVPSEHLQTPEWTNVASREFEAVGFYFQTHPLDAHYERLGRTGGIRRRQSIVDHMAANGLDEMTGRKLCGLVEKVETRPGRRGGTYVSVLVAERDDKYYVSWFPEFGQDVSAKVTELESAKTDRFPMVFLVRFGRRDGGGFHINATDIVRADTYAADRVPQKVTILVDPRHADVGSPEHMKLRELDRRCKEGDDSACHELGQQVCSLGLTAVNDLFEYLLTLPRDDGGHVVQVNMQVTTPDKTIIVSIPRDPRLPERLALSSGARLEIESFGYVRSFKTEEIAPGDASSVLQPA